MTWIKGVRGQENTIPRIVTYGVSDILPTVFKAFRLLAHQIVIDICRGKCVM